MVYCKNCKYCKYREFASLGVNWGWFCRLKEKTAVDSIGHKSIDFSDADCEKLNLDHKCPHYVKLWYKWWVKDGKGRSRRVPCNR